MKEIKPDLLLERLAGDVSSMLREDDGKKFVAENLAGNFLLHAIFVELSKSVILSHWEIPFLSFLYFSKGLIGCQESNFL